MPVVRMKAGGAAVTVSDEQVDNYRSKGWVVDGAQQAQGEQEDGVPAGNASRDAWAEHAESLGVEVPEDAKRDDIKALISEQAQGEQD